MPDPVKEKRHAKLGPSSSDIWLTCLGAPAEWEKYPPRKPGFAAKEGTLAHALCEDVMQPVPFALNTDMVFEIDGGEIHVTQEMIDAVNLYAATTKMVREFSLWCIIEKEVSFGWLWTPAIKELFGTADFAACDGITLYVIDFKYGAGKAVQPERNTQLLCYALGVFGQLQDERPDLAKTIENVCLVIVQPRAGGQPVRQWVINLGELLYWGFAVLKPTIDKIMSQQALPLVAGNHCYFCSASYGCPEYRRLKNKRSTDSFPDWTEDDDKV